MKIEAQSDYSYTQHKWIIRSVITVISLLFIYIYFSSWAGWERIEQTVALLSHSWLFVGALGMVFLSIAVRVARWLYYGRHFDWPIPAVPSSMAFIASIALTATPGKAGELVKSALLRMRYGTALSESAGVLLIERLTDLIAIVLFAVVGMSFFTGFGHYVLLSVVLLPPLVLFLGKFPLRNVLLAAQARSERSKKFIAGLLRLLDTAGSLLRPKPFIIGSLFALIAWSCEVMALYLIMLQLLPDLLIAPWVAFGVFGLATIVGVLVLLPGGVGGFEATAIFLLIQFGATPADAAIVTIVFRSITLWLMSFIGLIVLILWLVVNRNKNVR
jgi:uncharacterized protein (TIRG00374 family)